jgi:circadian clock protein KaiB
VILLMMAGDDKRSEVRESTADFEEALDSARWRICPVPLCVGMGMRSIQAIDNIKRTCEDHLPGRYNLEITDIYQQPIFARDGLIVAAPLS